ncbi:sulfatase-like hydrolase/transferase [Jiangella sp. DSM 45060]|uniref:sulfatase-like hydrolase/transferase n=1 Tax=Jiangella sp. DSM 45060 TaxID=1798224 RepID=UPI00087BFB41|nr:sulfatase-like hydrolase/transferase [Jiangella sp. DSM 45060]SDT13856.1 Arylsulfatase A [Jiangella sp. DSM 45060]
MTPPNILFLMTDQHRVDTLGCYGNPVVETPVLDELARTGTVLERCYTPTAICTPARASLLTGLHPFEHGLLSNYEWNSGHREELPDGLPTVANTLRGHGYRLGHAGKWHVGRHRGPEHYGYEGRHLPGALNPYDDAGYTAWLEEHGHPPFRAYDAIYSRLPDGSQGHLIAARLDQPAEATFEAYLADQTIAMLRDFARTRASGRPFALSCHFFGPHLPYLLPAEWFDRYDPDSVTLPPSMAETFAGKPEVQRQYSAYWGSDGFDEKQWRTLTAAYWGYVALIDHQIGRILSVLDELGLADQTAVMFTADHGEFTGAHRLNDKGPAMYEDIYRIPGILRLPGGAPPVRRHEFCTLLDFTATMLDLAGAPAEHCRGRSLVPLARGEQMPDWRQEVLCEFHGHHFPYAQRMLRDDRHKLVVNPEGVDELYDLELDPHELRNVIDVPAYAGAARSMRRRLYAELVRRGDRFSQWLAFMGDIPDEDRVRPETAVEQHVV